MLGYLLYGNLCIVSLLTSVAPVNMVSVSMMPAMAQLAGKSTDCQCFLICTFLESPRAELAILILNRSGNIVLLKFLVGLKQANEDGLVADLLVNVLRVCPDILARYFRETQYSYTPRCKSAWQENVQLLKKVKYLFYTYSSLATLCNIL